MSRYDRIALATEIGARIGFLGELEESILAEAFIRAEKAGTDLEAAARRLLLSDTRLTLNKVVSALEPDTITSGQPKPWHLPTCECGGSRWVDAGTNHLGNTQVAQCPHGGQISDAEWSRYHAYAQEVES